MMIESTTSGEALRVTAAGICTRPRGIRVVRHARDWITIGGPA